MKDIGTSVETLLMQTLHINASGSGIHEEDDLTRFGLDSLNCIRLIVGLEDHFRITIPEDRLGITHMRTIRDICTLIESVENNTAPVLESDNMNRP